MNRHLTRAQLLDAGWTEEELDAGWGGDDADRILACARGGWPEMQRRVLWALHELEEAHLDYLIWIAQWRIKQAQKRAA